MRWHEISEGVGRIVKGVNTTPDVGVDQTSIEAKKFGNSVDKDGKPLYTMHKKAHKNTKPNTLFTLSVSPIVNSVEFMVFVLESFILRSTSS